MKECGFVKSILGALMVIASAIKIFHGVNTDEILIVFTIVLCTGIALFAIEADEIITNISNQK